MTLTTLLIIILILCLVGALPMWPHAAGFGYGPSSVLGIILVVLVILVVAGRL